MGQFGNAGTRTKRTSLGFVRVMLSLDQHLHFYIVAQGGTPVFNLACSHKGIWREADFVGHPQEIYERIWPQDSSEVDATDDSYGVAFSFAHATKYTLVVERHNNAHNLIEIVKDIDYESNDSGDAFVESFTVLAL
jgi:hypothetical protein